MVIKMNTHEMNELFEEKINDMSGTDEHSVDFNDADTTTQVDVLVDFITSNEDELNRYNKYVLSLGELYEDLIIIDITRARHNISTLYDYVGIFDYFNVEDLRELDILTYNYIDTN